MNDDITHGLTSPFKCSPSSELIFTKIYLQKIKPKPCFFLKLKSSGTNVIIVLYSIAALL